MAPLIVNVGKNADETTKEALDNLIENFPGILVLETLDNLQSVSDTEAIPSGTMIMADAEEQLSSELLPERMFTCLGVYAIDSKNEETLRDKVFKEAFAKDFMHQLQSKLGAGPSVHLVEQNEISPKFGKDIEKWNPKLGSGYIGVAKHGEKYAEKYYIVVYTPDTDLSEEFLQVAQKMEEDDITSGKEEFSSYRNLLECKEYGQCVELAQRNNAKIALEAAKILKVKIAKKVDPNAQMSAVDFVKPEIAHRTYFSLWNHLEAGKINFADQNRNIAKQTVNIYNGCGSINQSMGGFPVPMSPRLGIQVYPEVQPMMTGSQNHVADAVPLGVIHTGIVGLDKPDLLFNEKHVFWAKKKGKSVHPKLQRNYSISRNDNFSTFMPEHSEHINLDWVSLYFSE